MVPVIRSALAIIALIVASAQPASAQEVISAPIASVDRAEVPVGEQIVVTIDGFVANFVTVSICGNDARRGSTDCNMRSSQSREVGQSELPTLVQLIVEAPPAPCPCLVRVSSPDNLEVAIAPITIVGHPTGPVVGGQVLRQSLTASIVAEAATGGVGAWLRSSLGGAVEYDATIAIRNASVEPVDDVTVEAWVGRGGGDVDTNIDIDPPAVLGPGQTWEQTVRVALSAPVFGSHTWRADVSSDQPTVSAIDETSHLPGLLLALVAFLVLDLLILAWRFVRRRLNRPKASDDRTAADTEDVGRVWTEPGEPTDDSSSRSAGPEGVPAEPQATTPAAAQGASAMMSDDASPPPSTVRSGRPGSRGAREVEGAAR